MSTTHNHKQTCCPACGQTGCAGLECLQRPRFFGGQLLTEEELNSLLDYFMAKNRLHNRMLHGWGTVCGLEVSCHECEGWVRIHPGYAIDPCGNDIVVCEPFELDLMAAIRACRARDRRRDECGHGYRHQKPNEDPNCQGEEEVWCITLRYDEQAVRPMMPLRRDTSRPCRTCGGHGRCGCGPCSRCGGSNGSCSCNGKREASCPPSRARTPIECEPTRTAEGYIVEVCRADVRCKEFMDLARGTLPARVMECLTHVSDIFQAEVPDQLYEPQSAQDAYQLCCHTLRALTRLYRESRFAVRCAALDELEQMVIVAPPRSQFNWSTDNREHAPHPVGGGQEDPGDTEPPTPTPTPAPGDPGSPDYSEIIEQLDGLLLQYVMDCICHAVLPPCPEDPEDDRVCLACVKIRDGKIEHICNLSCRRFAGSFNSWRHWAPIGALLLPQLCRVCCEGEILDFLKGKIVIDINLDLDVDHANTAISGQQYAQGMWDARDFSKQVEAMSAIFSSLATPAMDFAAQTLFPSLATGMKGLQQPFLLTSKDLGRSSSKVAERLADMIENPENVRRRPLREVSLRDRVKMKRAPTKIPPSARIELIHDDENRLVGWLVRDVRDDLGEALAEIDRLKADLAELRDRVTRATDTD